MRDKILVLFVISVLVLSMVMILSPDEAAPWFAGWKHRKSHLIQQTIGAGKNYQVNLTLFYTSGTDSGNQIYLDGASQTDFDDVRFTTESNELLSYWCQNYVEGVSARFWVQLTEDLTRSNVQIFIYYGNEDATSLSNQTETFTAVIDDIVMALPMDEGTGTTTVDYSSNGFNVSISGAEWTDGRYNTALNFDGVDDYVNTSLVSLNLLNSSFTFTAYVKLTYVAPDPPFASLPIVGNFPYIGISIAAIELEKFDIKGWMNGFSTNYNSKQGWGSWHHIAVMYAGYGSTERNLYVDGVLVGTDTAGTADDFTGVVKIGNAEYVAQPSSVIDEVHIYNRTFTPTQISNISSNYVYEDTHLVDGKVVVRKLVTPEPLHILTGSAEENESSDLDVSIFAVLLLFILLPVGYVLLRKRNRKLQSR